MLWRVRQFFVWGALCLFLSYILIALSVGIWQMGINIGWRSTSIICFTVFVFIGFLVCVIIEGNRSNFFSRHRRQPDSDQIEQRHYFR